MGLASEHDADQLLGRVLRHRWTLDRVIGKGGTGTVYAATHRNGAQVAIKVLHPAFRRDPMVRRRFLREGVLANRIGGPGVVKVISSQRTCFARLSQPGLKVLDFGVARILRAEPPRDDAAPLDDQCLGTPGFMAPEQARCQEELVDERTELWAVGATLFERSTLFNVDSPLAAIRWLTENHAELDPNMVRTSILDEVPRNSVWPVLYEDEAVTVQGSP